MLIILAAPVIILGNLGVFAPTHLESYIMLIYAALKHLAGQVAEQKMTL